MVLGTYMDGYVAALPRFIDMDWDDAGASFSPSLPMSGTGTGSLIPLPSRERGRWWFWTCSPALWIPAYAGMTV